MKILLIDFFPKPREDTSAHLGFASFVIFLARMIPVTIIMGKQFFDLVTK